MEVEKLNSSSQEITKNDSIVKKGELIVARIVGRTGPKSLVVKIKGKNYNALIKENIDGDIFLAKVIKTSPRLVLKFIKNLGRSEVKFNISNNFFNFKKEFIQKLIITDNFVVDDFFNSDFLNINDTKLLDSGKDFVSLIKRYLSNWYAPILKKLTFNQVKGSNFQKLYHKFLVFQSLYNIYNLEQLSFLIPLRIGDRKFLLSLMVQNRKNDLSQSVLVKIYIGKGTIGKDAVKEESTGEGTNILLLIYLDQGTVSCSLSSNNAALTGIIEKKADELLNRLSSKISGKKLEINVVPYNYLDTIDERNFKTIDINM